MGRPLKIQKYSTNSGINSPGAAVPIDQGFNNFGNLTDPVFNSAGTLSDADFLGVVGGVSSAATSATYPIVKTVVNITNSFTGQDDGYILRQKGAHKFLVATNTAIDPADAVVGVALRIASVGDTNWTAMGLSGTAAVGTIFTPTAAAGAGTTGTAQEVGVCVLDNDGTPAAGFMSVAYSVGDSSDVYASYLTNKWIRDWNGMTVGNYSDANAGNNVQSGENFYPVNFFTDEGTVTWSGAEVINGATAQNGTLQLAQVEKYTS